MSIPSENTELLQAALGKRLLGVRRQLFVDDKFLQNYEQEADGPVELTLSDGLILHFVDESALMSVGVASGKMPKYGESYEQLDVSKNVYWSERIDKIITGIDVFASDSREPMYPCEFVAIYFENNLYTKIVYLDEDEYQFDAIKISDRTPVFQTIWSMAMG